MSPDRVVLDRAQLRRRRSVPAATSSRACRSCWRAEQAADVVGAERRRRSASDSTGGRRLRVHRRPPRSLERTLSHPLPCASMPGEWWRKTVVYQIYVRSFADSDGDGVGDLNGVRSRLPYLRDLGVDGFWLTPFYPSPGADHGYDVADYTDVDPELGTLADFDALVEEAHALGLRVLVDIVPNHTSREHPWFRNALSSPDHPDRARYVFRPGRDGGPPNGWTSVFGGPAWTLDEPSGEWYLHLFSPDQPDLDWHNDAGAGRLREDPPLLARPRRRRLPHRRRAGPLQGAGPARDGRARSPDRALRGLGTAVNQPELHAALPSLAHARGRVPRRPHVRRRDRATEPRVPRELRRGRRAAPRVHVLARCTRRGTPTRCGK